MDQIGRGNRAENRRPSRWLRVGGQVSGLLGGGGPAGQQREAIGGGGGCRRGVDEQRESGVGGKLHGLEVEVEGADDGVAESLAAGPVEADVVGGPPGAEVLATGGKLADQLDELPVVGVAACLGAEHGGDVVGGALPVGEEVACGRVEVDEAGVVDGPARIGEERGVEGAGHPVGGEHVVPGVADPGGCVCDGVKDLLDAVGDAGGLRPPLSWRDRLGGAGQVGQVGAFGASSMWAWQFAKMQYLAQLHGWTRFVSMQNQYSLMQREDEREMFGLLADQGVGSIPWSPLAKGRLARPWGQQTARSGTDATARWVLPHDDKPIADAVERVAREHGVPMAQIALAWVLRNPVVSAPIVGPTKPDHLADAAAALDVTLTEDEISALEEHYTPRQPTGF